MDKVYKVLNYGFEFGDNVKITVQFVLIVTLAFIATGLLLRLIRKIINRKLESGDELKFNSVFSFAKYFIYIVVLLISLQNAGVEISAILTASAAFMVGIGLALRTFFQDIISGIFILIDQSVHVGDVIELDGKVGRVDEIKLRTTRAVTYDNKVLIIPNHKYLTSSLYNWTENGKETRENVEVGVAYGSDVQLVKELITKAASSHVQVLAKPPVMVLFTDFGDSSLDFKVIFTLNNSFEAVVAKSDIRFEIDKLFRENSVEIPFPQRDVHIKNTVG